MAFNQQHHIQHQDEHSFDHYYNELSRSRGSLSQPNALNSSLVSTTSLPSYSKSRQNTLTSGLDDSEWILFSPCNSSIDNEDDILSSSISHHTLNDAEHDSDIEDSIIDSFNDQFLSENRKSIYSNDDLETRIENWRKEQIHDMLRSLTRTSDSSTNLEYMKCWGIDDAKLVLKKRKRKSDQPKLAKHHHGHNHSYKYTPYGSDLLKYYNEHDVTTIRKLITKLSSELTTKDTKRTPPPSLYHAYLRNLKEAAGLDLKHKTPLMPGNNNTLNTSPIAATSLPKQRLLHNPALENYLPMFIKDLILENKYKHHRSLNAATGASNNFWESDLQSRTSSILSISTNSMMRFNLNEFA